MFTCCSIFVIKHHRGNINKVYKKVVPDLIYQLSSGWFSKQVGKASTLTSAYLLLVINDQGQELREQSPSVIATPRIFWVCTNYTYCVKE